MSTPKISNYDNIIVDIEGTVAPITFVHAVLFPYAKDNVKEFIETTFTSETTQDCIQSLISQAKLDKEENVEGLVEIITDQGDETLKESIVANVLWQMSFDRKAGALKKLQGHIWKKGYADGKLLAPLFDEVPEALRQIKKLGKKLYVYSSGSVSAQILLFKYTTVGDLTSLFDGNFDTAVGHKRQAISYTNIAQAIGSKPSSCLFLTDIYEESVAAKEAGMDTAILIRPENAPLPANNSFPTIASFDELF